MMKRPIEFILERSIPEPNSGCWVWTKSASKDGYGHVRFTVSGIVKNFRAHRVSYASFVCDPGDNLVLHKCDNRLCVNPDHLELGDNDTNMRQMSERGRADKPFGNRRYRDFLAKHNLTNSEYRRMSKDERMARCA